MSNEDLYVEFARQKADIAKLQSQVEALEKEVYQYEKQQPIREPQRIPEFDPKILTEHQWKGKKIGHRHWADGSLSWGWDFIGEFPEDVIAVLKRGDLTIGGYIFSLGERVVRTKKETAQ